MEARDNKAVERNWIVQTGKKCILSAGNIEQDGCVWLTIHPFPENCNISLPANS